MWSPSNINKGRVVHSDIKGELTSKRKYEATSGKGTVEQKGTVISKRYSNIKKGRVQKTPDREKGEVTPKKEAAASGKGTVT